MPIGKLILLGLLGLVVAEAAVFLLVARAFGSLPALVALFGTSVLGTMVLARMGRRMAGRLADMLSRQDGAIADAGNSGFLTMVGGILLVLPGFLTDIAGFLLLIPAVQRKLIERSPLVRPDRRRVLDLDRTQWRDLPDRHIEDGRENPPEMPPKHRRAP